MEEAHRAFQSLRSGAIESEKYPSLIMKKENFVLLNLFCTITSQIVLRQAGESAYQFSDNMLMSKKENQC